mgnify:CR=1 FL=1
MRERERKKKDRKTNSEMRVGIMNYFWDYFHLGEEGGGIMKL